MLVAVLDDLIAYFICLACTCVEHGTQLEKV